ncbi:MAG: glycosyltransferase [Salinivirgaceae bacterium]|nr:glycosyltransferase [Salinivirgaceae bacterium]
MYVLSSRREGFPCSLIEAMSQGCACVAFDCKTGPNEIITDGKSGLLARNGDINDLASKLQLLIEDETLRKKLSAGAMEEVKRLDKELIMKQWDELIRLTINS